MTSSNSLSNLVFVKKISGIFLGSIYGTSTLRVKMFLTPCATFLELTRAKSTLYMSIQCLGPQVGHRLPAPNRTQILASVYKQLRLLKISTCTISALRGVTVYMSPRAFQYMIHLLSK